jgi:hypothetical protein
LVGSVTPADAIAMAERALRRGQCPPKRHAEVGCETCDASNEAIGVLKTLPIITECENACRHAAVGSRAGVVCRHPEIITTRPSVEDRIVTEPAAWCPLRGAV